MAEYTWRIVHDPLGDFNLDGLINKDDYGLWRSTFGQVGQNLAADGNRDGIVDAADYAIWRSRDRSIVIAPPMPGASGSISRSADPSGAIAQENVVVPDLRAVESTTAGDLAFAELRTTFRSARSMSDGLGRSTTLATTRLDSDSLPLLLVLPTRRPAVRDAFEWTTELPNRGRGQFEELDDYFAALVESVGTLDTKLTQ